jgi:metal-dependent amidase/aminoacylase/carboxypeptidase family protein
MQQIKERAEQLAQNMASKYHLGVEILWTAEFTANENEPEAVDLIRFAAADLQMDHKQLEYPMRWGEDFGLFTQHFGGAMFGIGAGVDCPALHNPDYDFPDELIESSVNLFYHILKKSQ